jgi:Zn-dependent protease/predicted transcriptional regulator
MVSFTAAVGASTTLYREVRPTTDRRTHDSTGTWTLAVAPPRCDDGLVSGSLRVLRIFDIDVRIHFSWILIFLLVTFSLASGVLPTSWSEPKQLFVAAIAALLFFGSVVAHELAHALVARRFRMSVSSITLFLFGGVANLTAEPRSAMAELVMAVAGPLTSFALAGVAFLVERVGSLVLDPVAMSTVAPVAGYLTTVNLAVGVFNLVPGFPLDGGRVLRAVVWAIRGDRSVATAVAARGGQVVAALIALGGLLVLLALGDAFGLWYVLIGWFLFDMASASLQQERIMTAAKGVHVAQLMVTAYQAARPDMSVAELVRDLMLPYNLRVVPVVRDGRLIGTVGINEVHDVEQNTWPLLGVLDVMTPADRITTVTPDDELVTAIERFGESALLAVVQNGIIVGLLHRDVVTSYLRTRVALGQDGRAALRPL